jgi:hypothetical protein
VIQKFVRIVAHQKSLKTGMPKPANSSFYCKNCNKRFLDFYTYNAYKPNINEKVIQKVLAFVPQQECLKFLQPRCFPESSKSLKIFPSYFIIWKKL